MRYRMITTIAGGGFPLLGDFGPATSAYVGDPTGLVLDAANNLLIVTSSFLGGSRVRKVDNRTGIITTVAGSSNAALLGDGGLAIAADLSPAGVVFSPTEHLLVVDTKNGRVRKIDRTSGVITTVAGGGSQTGEGVPATEVTLTPTAIAMDRLSSLFIVDRNRVRKVDAQTDLIATVAGSGQSGFSGDGGDLPPIVVPPVMLVLQPSGAGA